MTLVELVLVCIVKASPRCQLLLKRHQRRNLQEECAQQLDTNVGSLWPVAHEPVQPEMVHSQCHRLQCRVGNVEVELKDVLSKRYVDSYGDA